MRFLPSNRKSGASALAIRLVKTIRRQTFFCQPNLPKLRNLLYNKAVLILLIMTGMRMAALAAGVGAALAGSPEQAEAQASGLTIPHPEGAKVYVVEDLSLDTQQQIMDALLGCLQEGAEVADFDGNGQVDPGDEAEFFVDDQASCAESAELQISIAKNEAATAKARDGQEAAKARIATANAEIEALTQKIIDGAQAETGS